jgi:hypothetical protein
LSERTDNANRRGIGTGKRRIAYLELIAIWQFVTGAAAFFLLFMFLIFTAMAYSEAAYFGTADQWGTEALLSYGVELAVGLGYIIPAFAGGIGLVKGYEWGRKLSIAHAVMSLILFPIGTVAGALSLRYLMRQDVKDRFSGGGQ